jgi:hypothetical protein
MLLKTALSRIVNWDIDRGEGERERWERSMPSTVGGGEGREGGR